MLNDETREMNIFERVIGVIVSPNATMKYLAMRPRLLFGLVAELLGALLFYLLRFELYKEYTRLNLLNNPANAGVVSNETLSAGVVQGMIAAPIGSVIWWGIIMLIIIVFVKLIKGKINLKAIVSVTGYAYTAVLVSYVIYCIISIFSGSLLFDLSLGRFTPGLSGTFLYGFLKSIDLFGIWYFILIAIGVSYACEISKRKSYIAMGIIYLLCAVLGAGSLMYS